jgi:collagen triple helix repeat protein
MLSLLRNRLGIPGVISVIALVFAMLGGAYAASNSGGGKATASAKAQKGPRGPRGARGPAGPAGPAGLQGAAGAKGADGAAGLDGEDGKDGKNGTNGVNGTNGTSVANTEFSGVEGPCQEGGSKLVGSATTYACNGKKGLQGDEGSPWTLGGTLPPGKTETGAWAMGPVPKVSCEIEGETEEGEAIEGECTAKPEEKVTAGNPLIAPISFPIPLAAELSEANTHYIGPGGTPPAGCTGGSVEEPKADPGHLCVYALEEAAIGFMAIAPAGDLSFSNSNGSKAGVVVAGIFWGEGARARGTWAVTAPS